MRIIIFYLATRVNIKYNIRMDNEIRAKIKYFLSLKGLTITKLAQLMSLKTGEKYTFQRISHKLRLGRLTLKEAYLIADILEYNIEFIPKS